MQIIISEHLHSCCAAMASVKLVKAQGERLEGTTVTQELKEQHCRNDLRWK